MQTTFNANKKATVFQNLLRVRIPEIVNEASFKTGPFNIKFEVLPIQNGSPIEEDGTLFYMVTTKCTIENEETAEELMFNVNLLKLPVLQELGFKIKGNYQQVLDLYDRALGWNLTRKEVADGSPVDVASLVAEKHRSFTFKYNEQGAPIVEFKKGLNSNGKFNVSVSTFFRAVTGMSDTELLATFGYNNPHVVNAFCDKKLKKKAPEVKAGADVSTRNGCIETVSRAMLGEASIKMHDVKSMSTHLNKRFFNQRYFSLGATRNIRLAHFQSFARRAIGRQLAETIRCGSYVFEKNTILDETELSVIDCLPVDSIKVRSNGKIYEIKKFTDFNFRALGTTLMDTIPELELMAGTLITKEVLEKLNDSELTKISVSLDGKNLTIQRRLHGTNIIVEDLFTAFNEWMNNINGYGDYNKTYELTNRVLVGFDKVVCDLIRNHVYYVVDALETAFTNVDPFTPMVSVVPDFGSNIMLDAFIQAVTDQNNNEGQMSDMCNLMAFASKSNKSMSNINSMSVTSDMVNVQDTQEGRLDPYDSPESSKLGLVHYRTVVSEKDADGNIVTPYVKVVNGKATDIIEYLTAAEEEGKFIAAWDETFVNDDGSEKEYVRARCDGTITSVATNNITYMESSPIQGMSAAHSCIPFAGHSNGKRITMSCNQQKQALITLKSERPLVGTGMESALDMGTVRVSDLIDKYITEVAVNSDLMTTNKDKLLNSSITLTYITKGDQTRTFTFVVDEAEKIAKEHESSVNTTVSVTVPFSLKNFENGEYTNYLVHKSDKCYRGNEVVIRNSGYDITDQDNKQLIDMGSLPFKDVDYTGGLALGKNVVVGYKTFNGSTIEDSLTISDRLIADSVMSSITIYEIEVRLHAKKSGKAEMFAADPNVCPDYFDFNGLPKIGTYLEPGDPVVCRSVDKKFTYKSLDDYKEGQVIDARIGNDAKGEYALVRIARISDTENGDKYSGRYGNKGVVAQIVPAADMPYDPVSGLQLDVILSPLGVPSRQNISQLLEVPLALCGFLNGARYDISPYHKDDVNYVKEQAALYDVHPVRMIDGRTGEWIPNEINVGVMYMYKLHHMAAKKIHSIGMDAPVDPAFLQPRKGAKNEGGQSFGEMESWCLESVGAYKVLQDLYSFQSDDAAGKQRAEEEVRQLGYVTETGVNNNDATMQALYRSLGIEIRVTPDKEYYETFPLTDSAIRGLAFSAISSASELHSISHFGKEDSFANREANKFKWGYMELKTEIVHPLWIERGSIINLVGLSTKSANALLADSSVLVIFETTLCTDFEVVSREELQMFCAEHEVVTILEGMEAIVYCFRQADIHAIKDNLERTIERAKAKGNYTEAKKIDAAKHMAIINNFIERGDSFENYIISAFPIMPQSFRPNVELGDVNATPDFDYHYQQIMRAVDNYESYHTEANRINIYTRIKEFIGIGNVANRNNRYQTLLSYFTGKEKEKDHGKIRSATQSKRVFCSGRAVIQPADTSLHPSRLGVPFTMCVKMMFPILVQYVESQFSLEFKMNNQEIQKMFMCIARGDRRNFKRHFRKVKDASDYIKGDAFNILRQALITCIEGGDYTQPQVVLAGRQPSLHKYSIRAFIPEVVTEKTIQINPLVCKGYNADFDGDQMWVVALYSDDAKREALEKLSPGVDFINPKNSKIMLEHSQDISLGCYCATILENNVIRCSQDVLDTRVYTSVDKIKLEMEAFVLQPHDLVVLSIPEGNYLSTAGRIVFNSLIPGAFTSQPFTNPMRLPVNTTRFSEMKYDGIITSGDPGSSDGLVYYSLQDICKDVYLQDPSCCLDVYYEISKFGFRHSDRYGVSLSIQDMDIKTNKDALIAEAAETQRLIERDFQNGLVSVEDKKDAIMGLYTNKKTGVLNKVKNELIDGLTRDNNIFIMWDSGARGNDKQIMHMCGAIGALSKTKTESMETPVINNYYEGLDPFDVHTASYSARTGVASTQNETRNAGYATRRVVYMTNGSEVVEHDCGNEDWWYKVEWADLKKSQCSLIPSEDFFVEYLLQRDIKPDSVIGQLLDKSEEDKEVNFLDWYILSGNEIPKVEYADGSVIEITPELMLGTKFTDKKCQELFKGVVDEEDQTITNKTVSVFKEAKELEADTTYGHFKFRYNLSKLSRSIMENREAADLPHLRKTDSFNNFRTPTAKTFEEIENQGIRYPKIRLLLNCKSHHGICARCYGLSYSNLQLPEVHDFVGTESAQSIGEPSAQLTMNVVNAGGEAGASMASGIEIFSSLLNGSMTATAVAEVATTSGYIHIKPVDSKAIVAIDDEIYEYKIPTSTLSVTDGQWVNAGEPISTGLVHPNSILKVHNADLPYLISQEEQTLRAKQIAYINNYFTTFSSNNVSINVRHFEILARIQNQYALVLESDNPSFKMGEYYEMAELTGESGVEYKNALSSQADVIMRNSGIMTAMTFNDYAGVAANITSRGVKSSTTHNCAPIGKLSLGVNFVQETYKELKMPTFVGRKAPEEYTVKDVEFVVLETPKKKISLGSIKSDTISKIDKAKMLASFDEFSAKTHQQEPIHSKSVNVSEQAPETTEYDDVQNDVASTSPILGEPITSFDEYEVTIPNLSEPVSEVRGVTSFDFRDKEPIDTGVDTIGLNDLDFDDVQSFTDYDYQSNDATGLSEWEEFENLMDDGLVTPETDEADATESTKTEEPETLIKSVNAFSFR